MEFWAVEVKAGQPLKVQPGDEKMIHISQVALGETKKETGNDSVLIFLKVDNQKMVIGTLSAKNIPQISFDLFIGEEFELSHNWKNGSLYFCGYKANAADDEDSSYYSDSEKEEEIDVPANVVVPNGITEPKKEKVKPAAVKDHAQKVKSNVAVAKKEEEATSDTDSDSEDEDIKDEDESDDLSVSDDSFDGSSDDDSMDEDEETPKKVEPSKKRATESTSTPVPAKKVKLATPQKTDAKKGTAHVATPHPSKQAAKTPAPTSEKSKGAATPKSAGTVACGSCSKKFNSEGALQSHTKAKHEAK